MKSIGLGVLATFAAVMVSVAPFPAAAANATEADAILSALESKGLLSAPSQLSLESAGSSAELPRSESEGALSIEHGLTVSSSGDTGSMSIEPVTDAPATFSEKALVYATDGGYGYALTGTGTAANAAYAVIAQASAPTEYRFAVTVNGENAALRASGEAIQVLDPNSGELTNIVQPAWAEDASGTAVPTSYEIDGNVIIQTVDHAGAMYPVVADPGLACDALFCTYMYSWSQTSRLANDFEAESYLVIAGCTVLAGPVGGFACGLSAAMVSDAANRAYNNGNCVGIRKLHYSPLIVHLVEESC